MTQEPDFTSKRIRVINAVRGTFELHLRPMCRSEGYVMYRPKGGSPAVMRDKEWLKLPIHLPVKKTS